MTSLWRVAARMPRERAEELRATFVSLAPEGFEERDAGDDIELAVYVDGEAPDASRAVVIDPGQAFGTGAHPTTRLCVELLARPGRRGSLLDVGCGSGVL